MTLTQRLTIRTSEQRSRLSELAGLDELTDEQRAELGTLGTEHQDTEAQLRAAIASAPDDANAAIDPAVDPEVRERLELRGSASLGRYLASMLSGQPVTGPEAEYQAACKVPGIPIDLFEQDRPETRADVASGVPATGAGSTLAPIQPFVFAQSIAPLLGDRNAVCRQRLLQRDDDQHGVVGVGQSQGRQTGLDRSGLECRDGDATVNPGTAHAEP